MSKKTSKIIDYLRNPKVIGQFTGSTLDGFNEVEFDTDKLQEMIDDLSQKELNELVEEVGTVCAQWSALRIASNNDIGTVARYQEADLIIGKNLSATPSEEQ